MVCTSRPNHLKFFKGCLPQILLGPFLNTFTQIHTPAVYVVFTSTLSIQLTKLMKKFMFKTLN